MVISNTLEETQESATIAKKKKKMNPLFAHPQAVKMSSPQKSAEKKKIRI